MSSIAAILTIIGYSLNDKVVIFDRIRENLRKYSKMPLAELLDLSINETLSRTVLTHVTTFLAMMPFLFFGGEAIFGFALAMCWGIVIGAYSSIYRCLAAATDPRRRRDGGMTAAPATAKAEAGRAPDGDAPEPSEEGLGGTRKRGCGQGRRARWRSGRAHASALFAPRAMRAADSSPFMPSMSSLPASPSR